MLVPPGADGIRCSLPLHVFLALYDHDTWPELPFILLVRKSEVHGFGPKVSRTLVAYEYDIHKYIDGVANKRKSLSIDHSMWVCVYATCYFVK